MTEAVGKVADRAALVEDMSDLDRILKEGKWAFIRSIEVVPHLAENWKM